MKKALFFLFVACISFGIPKNVYAENTLEVVTTTATFGDIVRQIGGERVSVKHVAPPKFNIHFIQPKPSDVRNVSKADLFVHGGLDLEAWVDPLLEAAGKPDLFKGAAKNLDVSKGIALLKVPTQISRAMGDIHVYGNPHYMMTPENAKAVAQTVTDKLVSMDPEHRELYEGNLRLFLSKMDGKIAEWKNACSFCSGQEIVSYHEDIEYLADFLGLKSEQYLEPKPGIPPTPKQMLFLEQYITDNHIKAIVLPTYYSPEPANALAKKTGTRVVFVGQSVGEMDGTDDVFDFYDKNIHAVAEALK